MPVQSLSPSGCPDLPIFSLEGLEAVGRSPFLSALLSELRTLGLRVVLVLSDDCPGTADPAILDCLRILAAGSDVQTFGQQHIWHPHKTTGPEQTQRYLTDLCQRYDLVLVSGPIGDDLPVLRLPAAETAAGISAWTLDMIALLREILWQQPVWACVLIGGRSSRMGRAKHLLEDNRGRSWLENTVDTLRPFAGQIVLSGSGLVSETLQDLPRIADIPGVAGPLTGILSAMRWQPEVSWLLVACDMPSLSPEAVEWLLDSRQPGCWATVPRRSPESHVEPLLAHYDRRCRSIFEEVLASGSRRIGDVARHEKIATPVIPEQLSRAWDNINTPEELQSAIFRGPDRS